MSERKPNWNINPVHLSSNSLTNSASHYPVNYYNSQALSPKAFHTVTSLTSSASHFPTGRFSGFQYLTQTFFQLSRTLEEDISASEDAVTTWTKNIEEDVLTQDLLFDGTSRQEEDVSITDSILVTLKPVFEDYISSTDTLTKTISQEEEAPIYDSIVTFWTKHFEEDIQSTDLPQSAYLDQQIYSMTVALEKGAGAQDSLTIANEVYSTEIDTLVASILRTGLSPVTSISAMVSGSSNTPVVSVSSYGVTTFADPLSGMTVNPFQPTVVVGGTVYSTYAGTNPGGITSNSYFINRLNPSIGAVDSCQLLNFDINIDRAGGSFSFVTLNDPGIGLGSSINLFGLIGTVTEVGQIFTNNQVGTLTKGIFGARNLNKQINVLGAGNVQFFALLTNSLLSTQQEQQLRTYAGAAFAIAAMAGINLHWATSDVPLVDFTVSEGETALSALSSIAAQFGATFFWDGGNNYTIGAPTITQGAWSVPNQAIITPAGIQYTNKLDIETGATGTGAFMSVIEKYFDPSIYGLPTSIDVVPKVQRVGTCRQALTTKDPLWIQDLPLDTAEAWLQILVKKGDPSIGTKYVTADPEEWTSLGSPSIAGPTVKYALKGGALGTLTPQTQIGSNLFPNIDVVNNGNFIMSVGVTRNNQVQLFEQAKKQRDDQVRALQAKLLGTFKYVQTYSGTINCFFFGSIPLPGMQGSATVCGNTVNGVIESVSLSFPGVLTVGVAQFALVNYVRNFYHIDFGTKQIIT